MIARARSGAAIAQEGGWAKGCWIRIRGNMNAEKKEEIVTGARIVDSMQNIFSNVNM